MTIINENTVVIFTSEELKTALENDNGYNYIYLGNNIALTSGIKISSTKPNVTIDGTYNGVTYQFEDRKTLNASDTINVSYPSILKVTVTNMNIIGYNYYGIIYVPESSLYQNTIVEYNNITYTGPQICFHPNGLTRFIDSTITIEDGSVTTGGEVAECNKIEIGGTTTITHKSKGNSAFWFRNTNPSLTILTNAIVNFTSQSRELIYGPTNLTFTLLSNATFNITTANGLSYGTFGTGETILYPNSSLEITKTTYSGSYATWYSYGKLTLNTSASLTIINDYPNITTSNYNIYFSSSNSGFILNNPSKVILYNTKANIIYTNSTIPFQFQFSRINLFTNPITIQENISSSTLPTYAWYKEDTYSTINGTFTATTTKVESHNFTEEELATLPALTNFIFPTKKILSLGSIPLKINALTDVDTVMKGTTEEEASILITYNEVETVVTASDQGIFEYDYTTPLPIGTTITFYAKKYNDLLYHTKTIQIIYPGELVIDDATKMIVFELSPISLTPILCPKKESIIIHVTDTRVNSTNWRLYATLEKELTSQTGIILKDAIVYLDQDKNIIPLSTEKTLVYTGETNEGESKTTEINWNKEEGILLQITDRIENGLEYQTNIIWTIEE